MRIASLPLLSLGPVAPAAPRAPSRIASAEQLAALELVAQAAADLVDRYDEVITRSGDTSPLLALGDALDGLTRTGDLGGTPAPPVSTTQALALWGVADGSKSLHQQLAALLAAPRAVRGPWKKRIDATLAGLRRDLATLS